MSNFKTNCRLTLISQSGPTYRSQVVNPRHQKRKDNQLQSLDPPPPPPPAEYPM